MTKRVNNIHFSKTVVRIGKKIQTKNMEIQINKEGSASTKLEFPLANSKIAITPVIIEIILIIIVEPKERKTGISSPLTASGGASIGMIPFFILNFS